MFYGFLDNSAGVVGQADKCYSVLKVYLMPLANRLLCTHRMFPLVLLQVFFNHAARLTSVDVPSSTWDPVDSWSI